MMPHPIVLRRSYKTRADDTVQIVNYRLTNSMFSGDRPFIGDNGRTYTEYGFADSRYVMPHDLVRAVCWYDHVAAAWRTARRFLKGSKAVRRSEA